MIIKKYYTTLLTVLTVSLLINNLGFSQKISSIHQTIDSLQKLLKSKNGNKIVLYNNLSKAYNDIQNDSAMIYIEQAIKLSSKLNNDRFLHTALNEKSRYYFYNNETEYRKKIEFKRLIISEKLNDKEMLFDSYRGIGSSYISLQELDSAALYLEKAKVLIKYVKNKKILGNFHITYALLQSYNNNLELAVANMMKAAEYYESINDDYSLATAYNNIGICYTKTNEIEKAISYHIKSLEYSRKTEQNRLITINLFNLSSNYLSLNQVVIASKYAEEGLVYAKKINDKSMTANLYNNIAMVKLDEKNYSDAILYNTAALEIFKILKNYEKQALTLENIAITYIEKGDFKKSIKFAEDALAIAKNNNILLEQQYTYELLSEIDSLQGRYSSSLYHYKKSIEIRDSIEKITNDKNVSKLKIKFETLEKEKKIIDLNSQNESKELRIINQRYQNYALLMLLILATLGLINVFFQIRSKRRVNRLLSNKNIQIEDKNNNLNKKSHELEKALVEKDVLLKEVHHRVKNNLQLVTSMLNLQADRLDDEKINAFVETSQSRITSMAIIHQILYSNNKIEFVNFHQYLLKLIKAGYDSFDFSQKDITYIIDAEGFSFHINTAIPLGIIINEIVHNTFKHAFKGLETGILKVSVSKEGQKVLVIIEDNGVGITEENKQKSTSFGLNLVELLVRQIEGEIVIEKNNGTITKIFFEPIKQ